MKSEYLVEMAEVLKKLSNLLKSQKALSGYVEIKDLMGCFGRLTELTVALKLDRGEVKDAQEDKNLKVIDQVCEANMVKPRELLVAFG